MGNDYYDFDRDTSSDFAPMASKAFEEEEKEKEKKSHIRQLIEALANQEMQQFSQGVPGGVQGGGLGGAAASSIGSMLGQLAGSGIRSLIGFQHGGRISGYDDEQPYVVGEAGPELALPDGQGNVDIVPVDAADSSIEESPLPESSMDMESAGGAESAETPAMEAAEVEQVMPKVVDATVATTPAVATSYEVDESGGGDGPVSSVDIPVESSSVTVSAKAPTEFKLGGTPHLDNYARLLQQLPEKFKSVEDRKPGIGNRIGSALLGAAQGYLATSESPRIRNAMSSLGPQIHRAQGSLMDSGRDRAMRNLTTQLSAAARLADIEEKARANDVRGMVAGVNQEAQAARTLAAAEKLGLQADALGLRRQQFEFDSAQKQREFGLRQQKAEYERLFRESQMDRNSAQAFSYRQKGLTQVTDKDGLVWVANNEEQTAQPLLDPSGKQVKQAVRQPAPRTSNAPKVSITQRNVMAARALAQQVIEQAGGDIQKIDSLIRESQADDDVKYAASELLGRNPLLKPALEAEKSKAKAQAFVDMTYGGGGSKPAPTPKPAAPTPKTAQGGSITIRQVR